MTKQHQQHPAHIMTSRERNDFIRFLLRPNQNRDKLHIPVDSYFAAAGLNDLANDAISWIGHSRVSVQVVVASPVKTGWSVTLQNHTAYLYIDSTIANQRPFLAAHYTILGVLAIIVKKFSHMRLTRETRQQIIEDMSIVAGFGLYALNACYEIDLQHPFQKTAPKNALLAIPLTVYIATLKKHCSANAIKLENYKAQLLPHAREAILQQPLDTPASSFVQTYIARLRDNRERIAFVLFIIVFSVLFGIAAWPHLPKPLSRSQRAMIADIEKLQGEYAQCNAEFRHMLTVPYQPDILSQQTLQAKASTCQELKQQHDETVQVFNRSL